MIRAALMALTALSVSVAPVGCGGEARRGPVRTVAGPPPAAVTVNEPAGTARVTDPARAAYIRRADRVCADLDPRRESKLHEVEGASDPAGAYAQTVTLAREQLRRIEAIHPPAGDRELIARNVIDRLRERLGLRDRLQRDVADDDADAAARDQSQFEALGVAVHSFARGYGFRKCGTG
jgi:hypothetical protein